MIKFLLKGILRDRSRSILPVIIISIGVALTVLLSGYIRGALGDITDQNARFDTGHVKVMTKAYAENIDQLPNDLALLEVGALIESLQKEFPQMDWVKRTRFGGLIDVPDEEGNSKGQGPAAGMAINLLEEDSGEAQRMNIESAIVSGNIPRQKGGALIGHDFAQKLGLKIGDEVTYFGTTMNGSMSFQNFQISGTIRYGMAAMDRGALVIDITDAQRMLDMEDGTGEVLGYLKNKAYNDETATSVVNTFNAKYANDPDEFAPVMKTLKQQNNLADLLNNADMMSGLFVIMFVAAMSV
ncbi:MAG: ABC transporter permease, partial [Chitinophagales bacterium]